MKVTRHGLNWTEVLNIARLTQNKPPVTKEPSEGWKRKLIRSRHSPLRLIQFLIVGEAPGFVITHLARHTYQLPQPFVGTAREDITGTQRPPDTAVRPFAFYMNADSLIDVAEQRLCKKAHKDTRWLVKDIIKQVGQLEPLLLKELQRPCIKTGVCKEFTQCGYMGTADYKVKRGEYKRA